MDNACNLQYPAMSWTALPDDPIHESNHELRESRLPRSVANSSRLSDEREVPHWAASGRRRRKQSGISIRLEWAAAGVAVCQCLVLVPTIGDDTNGETGGRFLPPRIRRVGQGRPALPGVIRHRSGADQAARLVVVPARWAGRMANG